ncbi:MAG: NAD-dependent epimerase, partial [Tissierella sp.]|nr:NAD-dependent epimerase [Tissierella sp.]
EELIKQLGDESFKVAIIRPPMVYGKGCKGKYPRLTRLAVKTPIFPDVDNKRSMIYIDNLSEFVRLLIDNNSSGLFLPQNSEYVNTSEMVKLIAGVHGKKIIMTKIFNPILKRLDVSIVNKVFGDLVYGKELQNDTGTSIYKYFIYETVSFKESIIQTESEG